MPAKRSTAILALPHESLLHPPPPLIAPHCLPRPAAPLASWPFMRHPDMQKAGRCADGRRTNKTKKKIRNKANKNRDCASFYGPSSSGIPSPLKHKIPQCSRNTLPWTRKKIHPPGTYNTINKQAWFMHQANSLARPRICSSWASARNGVREDETSTKTINRSKVARCVDSAGRRIVDSRYERGEDAAPGPTHMRPYNKSMR
ncbi:hypothetical protein M752DRAFT_117186 [Aspergillus phoenicis ATCC 13157]|uniref:Uncharacterized protein n=1 Tax=Aspergillus phoenicis ATCC 13157 TaxID=1353007 RepID=A0A370PSY0_ASPPH|nr:hypothetical protein M752DRAFT_117186 [Aspergillus phoenicis ATCC 13157]